VVDLVVCVNILSVVRKCLCAWYGEVHFSLVDTH